MKLYTDMKQRERTETSMGLNHKLVRYYYIEKLYNMITMNIN